MSSFSDKLKEAQNVSEVSVASYNLKLEPAAMTLVDESGMIAAYSGEDAWLLPANSNLYDYYTDYYDENFSTVDENKNITLSTEQINLTQEKNSQYIPFKINRYYDGFDLATTELSFYWVNELGYGGTAFPVDVYYNSERIKFAWLVDDDVTAVKGKIEFEIHAEGTNSKGRGYLWKTKSNNGLNVLQALEIKTFVEPDETWQTSFVEKLSVQADRAEAAALAAEASATSAQNLVNELQDGLADEVQAAISDNYYTKTETENYVTQEIEKADISDKLADYALKTEIPTVPTNVSAFTNDAGYLTEHQDISGKSDVGHKHNLSDIEDYEEPDLSGFALKEEIPSVEGLATETFVKEEIEKVDVSEQFGDTGTNEDGSKKTVVQYVDEAVAAVDVSEQLQDYYKKEETYNKGEIDEAIGNVEVDLTGYATESFVNEKISPVNTAITSINQTLETIDKSPKTKYRATYGDVELDDGTTAEYMFTLWKEENGVEEVQDRFQILGGGGSTSSVNMVIAYVEGYGTPLVATADDKVILKYDFSGEDSAGDTNLDGTASWKVGSRVVKTEDVSTGVNEFDLTDYVNVGDNKVVLTITHATGAMATKAWTIKIVDVRLVKSFDDKRKYPANSPINYTFIPYGGIEKTVHFILDGEEIGTKTSLAASSGLSDSYDIPAYAHGTHLLEVYMTATVNGKAIESNHLFSDIIWYDETSLIPVISCTQQEFTARQYETTNIEYTVYDSSTETPVVTRKATYVNEDGEIVETYNSTSTLQSNTDIWSFKTDIIGEHTLTISCGETVKTLKATITEIGIEVSPVTSGLVFDFNPVGYSNNDENRIWNNGTGIAMAVSDNFDWVNGGYQIDENGDQCFCIKAGTSAEINYELFGDDAKTNGKQMKLIFKTENVADAETTFLECLSDAIGTDPVGIEMKAQTANIYAKTEFLPLPYAEEEIIEFEFNITTSADTIPMVMGYEDGVSTRPMVYGTSHDFQQHKDHRKIISLGSPDCDLYIYRFKVYNISLSDRDILNNFIADARSAEEMISRYERNQIYQDGVLTPEYLAEMCPDLRIIKIDCPRFTKDKDDKVGGTTIECIYKNGDPILDNWVATDCVHSGQGTSSNNYGASGRNLDLIMKTYKDYGNSPVITLGDGTAVNKVSLTRNSVDANYFNVKVNIASSENANNALFAKRYNEFNPYNRPFVRDNEAENAKIKDTMEFQNCVIFLRESGDETHTEFTDNNYHFYAIGNIGDSKKNDKSKLTDPDDPYECILEVMDNTLPLSTMPTGKVDENGAPVYPISPSEWAEGNSAYDALQAELFDETEATKKENGLADTYGWRYIYEDGSDEENEEAKAFVENKWREFYKFVVTSTDEEFKANLGDWVVLDSVMYYYLFVLRYTMTDNFAKNSFWHYGKSNDLDAEGNPIRKFDLAFAYDMDTSLGIDNYGRMTYRYGYEEIDYVDGTSDWVWNAPQHVFFLRLRELFDEELCALYTRLEGEGAWSSDSLIKQFNDWQMQFPEELWRLDIERKYIRTYTTSFINGEAKPEFLKERANGRKKTHRSQFERNQEKYMSSKFGGTVASGDDIILRCSVPNTELAIPAKFDLTLTPYSYVYLNVKYNTSPPVKIRAVPGEEYTIEYTADLADIIEIYSASCLKSIGDMSPLYLINADFSNAKKLRELILGNATDGYNNTNSMTLGLGSNDLLNKLDIQNMSGLTSELDVSGLRNLEELYAIGSNISGVTFADGGNISIAEIPNVGSLSMKNLYLLDDDGFEVSSYSNLTKLVAEHSELDLVDLLNSATNLYQVRLVGVNWNLEDASLLERLYNLAGVNNAGGNADYSVLSGYVYISGIRQYDYYKYKERWSDLEIEYGAMTPQFVVTFVNDDGTVLDVQYVDQYTDAVDPIKRPDNPILTPIKESTVSTNYTFAGWDRSFTSVGNDITVKATYTESTRQYSVKYVQTFGNTTTTLQDRTVDYGTYSFYEGSTPTYTAEEQYSKYYLFNRWDKSGYVDGDKIINAIYDECYYSNDTYFNDKALTDLSAAEIYALTRLIEDGRIAITTDESDIDCIAGTNISAGDAYSFNMGHDYDYDDLSDKTYTLVDTSSPRTFTGATGDYLDTGIAVLDMDRDFVLAVDYEFASGNDSGAVLMECYDQNSTRGFKLSYISNPTINWLSSSAQCATGTNREMLVLRHVAGEPGLHVYMSDLSGDSIGYISLDNTITTITTSYSLIFGCGRRTSTTYNYYAKGTIHWAKLWYADLGEEACRKLATYIHEDVSLKIAGFNRYYQEDGEKLSTIDFIADKALYTKKGINNGTNVNGWASATLNTWLNNRFYSGLPLQIRQLIKKVKVKSRIGAKSSDISFSYCYIYIPAISELINASPYNASPYTLESDAVPICIPHMTAEERIIEDYNGEAVSYWTRSPSDGGSGNLYYLYMNTAGSVQTVGQTTSQYGVVIELSF